jgi:ABC-2 type transport system ATP-binding protein
MPVSNSSASTLAATLAAGTGAAVSVTGLVKRFGEIEAVKGVTFDVGAGEIFAFLGPNGAGKSTTIKMLCTLLRPTSGHATVAGHDVALEPKAARAHIGFVFQDRTLDEQLTAEENLAFHECPLRHPQAGDP